MSHPRGRVGRGKGQGGGGWGASGHSVEDLNRQGEECVVTLVVVTGESPEVPEEESDIIQKLNLVALWRGIEQER